MPADKLRVIRIKLLKITHSPIVAAIWLFDSANDKVKGAASDFSSIGPAEQLSNGSGPVATRRQRPFLSNRANSKTYSQVFPDLPTSMDGASHRSANGNGTKGKSEDKAELQEAVRLDNTLLEEKVADQSAKIEELSAMMADQSAKFAELTALIMAQQGTVEE